MKFWSTSSLIILLMSAFFMTSTTACEKPSLAGNWINPEADLKELSRLEFNYNCGDRPIKSYDPMSSALWIVRARVKCPRADCSLGRAKGNMHESGAMRIIFDGFSAVHKLQVTKDNKLIRVEVATHYRDDRRRPIHKTYFLHQEN